MRCDHGKADDDGRGEVSSRAGNAAPHRPELSRHVQLPLLAAALAGEGFADERRDRRRALGGLSLATQHAPRRGLFSTVAQQKGKLGWPVCSQVHAPFRPRELVARRDAGVRDGDGQAGILHGRDGAADGADGAARAMPHVSGEVAVWLRARSFGEPLVESALRRSGGARWLFSRPLRFSRRHRH